MIAQPDICYHNRSGHRQILQPVVEGSCDKHIGRCGFLPSSPIYSKGPQANALDTLRSGGSGRVWYELRKGCQGGVLEAFRRVSANCFARVEWLQLGFGSLKSMLRDTQTVS